MAIGCVGSSPIVGTSCYIEGSYMIAASYFPIIFFVALAAVMGIVMKFAGRILGPHKPYAEKNSPYECGFEAFEDARVKFDVRYYLIAIIFILFDLEIAFLFPWALVFKHLGVYGFVVMSIFLAILIAGFAYIWKKGALEWE